MRIALIGCGAIGRALLELLRAEPAITVAALVVPQAHAAATQALARELAPEAAVAAAVPSRDIDLVVEAGLKLHDFAALVPVVEGAGGTMCDWNGDPLNADSAGHVIALGDPARLEDLIEGLTCHH